jgi:hypothetical protein
VTRLWHRLRDRKGYKRQPDPAFDQMMLPRPDETRNGQPGKWVWAWNQASAEFYEKWVPYAVRSEP